MTINDWITENKYFIKVSFSLYISFYVHVHDLDLMTDYAKEVITMSPIVMKSNTTDEIVWYNFLLLLEFIYIFFIQYVLYILLTLIYITSIYFGDHGGC